MNTIFYMWKTQMRKTKERFNSQENITSYMVFTKWVAHCQNTKRLTVRTLIAIKNK